MITLEELKKVQYSLFLILKDIDILCQKYNIQYFLSSGSVLGAIRHNSIIPWDDDIDIMMFGNDYEKFLDIASKELDKKYFVQRAFVDWPRGFSKVRLNGTTFIEESIFDKNVHQGFFVDIFPINNLSNHKCIAWFQWKASRMLSSKCSKRIIKTTKSTKTFKEKISEIITFFFPKNFLIKVIERKSECNSKYVQTFLSAARKEKNIFPREIFVEQKYVEFVDGKFPVPFNYDLYLKIIYGDYMKLPPEDKRLSQIHAKYYSFTKDYKEYIDEIAEENNEKDY